MIKLKAEILPCPEPDLRAAMEDYKAALLAHSKSVGEPAPVPGYDLLREFVYVTVVDGVVTVVGDFEVIDKPKDPIPPTLEELRQRRRMLINSERDQLIAAGVTYGGVLFDSDGRSRENLTGAVVAFNAGIPVPDNFMWRSADNQNIPMDLPALIGLAAAMLTHVNSVYGLSWQRKAALEAATTPEQIEAA